MNHFRMPRGRGTFAILLTVSLAGTACDSGTEPLEPHGLQVVAGDGQTGTVGNPVAVSPSVRVVTARGKPVPNVAVTFAVSAGGGTILGPTQTTDASGVATATGWILGTAPGDNTLTVSSAALAGVTATIRVTAAAGEAYGLAISTQPASTANSGSALSAQPVVRLVDRFGNAVAKAGVVVTALNADSRITLANQTATTSEQGIATFSGLTLRGLVGVYSLEFRATGLSSVLANSLQLAAGPAHHLGLATEPPAAAFATQKITPSPVVEIQDEFNNVATTATAAVTVDLLGAGTLAGSRTVSAAAGRATFADLIIQDTGTFKLRFTAPGLGSVETAAFQARDLSDGWCALAGSHRLTLTLTLGQTVRTAGTAANAPECLEFDFGRSNGQQYLVMFENMPVTGVSSSGLFPGLAPVPPSVDVKVEVQPATFTASSATFARQLRRAAPAPEPVAGWDFGDGPIYEGQPAPVTDPSAVMPKLIRNGRLYSLSAVHPQVGDTVQVLLEGISRLGIPTGQQKVVVRHISDQLIFAEDTRLGTLTREGGGTNTPLTQATMDSIAQLYAEISRVQGNLLFDGGFNNSINSYGPTPKVLAIHTLMYSNHVWGYTYPSGYYFAYDFWVGSNGSTRGLSQNAQRLADNLFMHEIAHMRHWGVMERAGVSPSLRGNTWLVEGFARFSERLSVANRLLGTTTPSRLDNLQLPYNQAFNNSYYFDDVPTYLHGGSNMFGGYSASSFVFDYFLDQVAASGKDHLTAVREFLIAGGTQATLDAAVNKWLPGLTFGDLFTRARIALYADDYGTSELPASTQYLQFQLRASRPPGSQSANDPRNSWVKLKPGESSVAIQTLSPGSAVGFLIDGTVATASAKILLTARDPNAVVSITRIR